MVISALIENKTPRMNWTSNDYVDNFVITSWIQLPCICRRPHKIENCEKEYKRWKHIRTSITIVTSPLIVGLFLMYAGENGNSRDRRRNTHNTTLIRTLHYRWAYDTVYTRVESITTNSTFYQFHILTAIVKRGFSWRLWLCDNHLWQSPVTTVGQDMVNNNLPASNQDPLSKDVVKAFYQIFYHDLFVLTYQPIKTYTYRRYSYKL